MQTTLTMLGLGCIIGAIAGGSVNIVNIIGLPVLAIRRQVLLGVFGIGLVVWGNDSAISSFIHTVLSNPTPTPTPTPTPPSPTPVESPTPSVETLKRQFANAWVRWADVQAAFKTRADLIPNLAAAIQGSDPEEKSNLDQVIMARAKASGVQIRVADLEDPQKLAQFAAAQTQLSTALALLLNTAQPNNISNYQMLKSQIEGQQNRINVALRDYDRAVQQYNATLNSLPATVGMKQMVPYQMHSEVPSDGL